MAVRVKLRPARADDALAIAAIYAPIVRDTAISFETEPPDADEIARRIEASGGALPWLVAVRDERVAGYAYATKHRERAAYRWSVDVSVYVHEAARREGVGVALYGALLPTLCAQGFHRAHAGITLPNPASVRLHESIGFRPVGVYREVGFKCGSWHDVGWWQYALAEPRHAPPEPLRFDRVADTPEVVDALARVAANARSRS